MAARSCSRALRQRVSTGRKLIRAARPRPGSGPAGGSYTSQHNRDRTDAYLDALDLGRVARKALDHGHCDAARAAITAGVKLARFAAGGRRPR